MNVNPPNVSQHNSTTSNSTNVILSSSFHNRTRPISTNSGHCKENCTGSHLENEGTASSSKTTPSKQIRRSLRRNMVRNMNVYNKHVKKHKKEYSYLKALRALREGRNTNPAHEDAFNSIYGGEYWWRILIHMTRIV